MNTIRKTPANTRNASDELGTFPGTAKKPLIDLGEDTTPSTAPGTIPIPATSDNLVPKAPESVGKKTCIAREYALTEEELLAIGRLRFHLDSALRDIREKNCLSNMALVDIFFPTIPNASVASKILAHTGKDKRHVDLDILAVMHIVFGVSIDGIIDGIIKPRAQYDRPERN